MMQEISKENDPKTELARRRFGLQWYEIHCVGGNMIQVMADNFFVEHGILYLQRHGTAKIPNFALPMAYVKYVVNKACGDDGGIVFEKPWNQEAANQELAAMKA